MILYHYTNLEAFLNIINGDSIWLSSSEYLNDYSEGCYGESLFSFVNDLICNGNFKKSFNYQKSFIDTFIFSLCEDGDLLGQWKYYGNKDDGLSIGFNLSKLNENQNESFYRLKKVKYISSIKDSSYLTVIEEWRNFINKGDFNNISSIDNAIILLKEKKNLSRDFFYDIFSFKQKVFSEEKEWRIIATSYDHKIFHRYNNKIIMPYIKVNFQDILSLIDVIIVHPNSNDRTINSIKDFVNGYKGRNIKIIRSKIPFIK